MPLAKSNINLRSKINRIVKTKKKLRIVTIGH